MTNPYYPAQTMTNPYTPYGSMYMQPGQMPYNPYYMHTQYPQQYNQLYNQSYAPYTQPQPNYYQPQTMYNNQQLIPNNNHVYTTPYGLPPPGHYDKK